MAHVYQFGRFHLDAKQRLLFDAGTRQPVSMPPRLMDTLLYFLEHPGSLIEKTALMEAVWPGVVVEENSLSQNISMLRRLLGENPGENRFIVTAPGKGYRFVADVAAVGEVSSVTPTRDQSPEIAIRVSIAVMPFANLTGDSAKEYFSDGMAEEIINMLTRLSGLRVPARTSTFAYKGQNVDIRQIASDLGVDAILQGSVRSAGERVRIAAQLIDGKTGYQLWSQSFDREMTDIFGLQDELSVAIVDALRTTLNASITSNRRPPIRTRDIEAYRSYLLANWPGYQSSARYVAAARELYNHALSRDPDFASAHAGLASTYMVESTIGMPVPEALAMAESEAHRALQLDPEQEAGHAVLGQVSAVRGDFCKAEESFRKALDLYENPLTTMFHGTMVLQSAGYLRQNLREIQEAFRFAPFMPIASVMLSLSHVLLGRNAEAVHYADLAVQFGALPNVAPLVDIRAMLAMRNGAHEEAADDVLSSMNSVEKAQGVSEIVRLVHHAIGGKASAGRAIRALGDMQAAQGAEHTMVMRKRLLLWYVMLNALDNAFQFMDETLDELQRRDSVGSAWGLLWLAEMRPFREDPRFQQIARRMGLFDFWNENGPPDDHQLVDGRLVCR